MKINNLAELKAVVGTIFVDTDGKRRLQCLMSDNSVWICELNGTNWNLAVPPMEKLTEGFQAEYQHQTHLLDLHNSRGHRCTKATCIYYVQKATIE